MRIRTLLLAALAGLATACQSVQATNDAAVDYNRAFARARDEITVLNVLRAAARQPLQFSTIASVQGAVRSGASLRVPFVNLIDGGPNAISPEVTLSARNPTVSITPLATREFVQGISRPLSPGVIDDLLLQGWPLEVVLGLTVGGVICPDGSARINSGDDPALDQTFVRTFRETADFGFEMDRAQPYARLRMSGRDALGAIREGAGERRIGAVAALPPGPPGSPDAEVEIVTPGEVRLKGIDFREVCAAGTGRAREPVQPRRDSGVLMRSVLGIFHYLGKAHAADRARHLAACGAPPDATTPLLHVEVACAGRARPARPVVATEFDGRSYFIRRAGEGQRHRTLETLSLLTYLVDLQTSETAVKSSVPFIAITQP